MAKYAYGIKSFKIADIDPATGGPLAGTVKEVKEAIYRDSFNLTETEGSVTDHFSEMGRSPKKRFREAGIEDIVFSIMEAQTEMLALFLGGRITTVNTKPTWSKPKSTESNEKHLTIETMDGFIVTIPRADMIGKKNFQFSRNKIWLIDVTATPLDTGFPNLADIDISEPAA